MTQRDWMIVTRDAQRELRVVSVAGRITDWRRLSNVLRGADRDTVRTAINAALESGQIAPAGTGCVIPVDTPGGTSAYAAIYLPALAPGDTYPDVGSWEWRPNQEALPPTLHLSPVALSLLGISAQHQDRTAYGPADLWTRTTTMVDVLASMSFVFEGPVGSTRTAQTLMQAETGDYRSLHTAECVIQDGANRIVRSIVWEDLHASATEMHLRGTDMGLASIVASASGQDAAVLDFRFPAVPIICKWITAHTPGLGHGASTGQTSGWHPEDMPRIWEYLQTLAALGADESATELDGIRVRQAGGGWLQGKGRAYRLSPLHPTVWVVVGQKTGTLADD